VAISTVAHIFVAALAAAKWTDVKAIALAVTPSGSARAIEAMEPHLKGGATPFGPAALRDRLAGHAVWRA
jgi:hypothetical protein